MKKKKRRLQKRDRESFFLDDVLKELKDKKREKSKKDLLVK